MPKKSSGRAAASPRTLHRTVISTASIKRKTLFAVVIPYDKESGETEMRHNGAPKRGKNVLFVVPICHNTKTASSPPDNKESHILIRIQEAF